MKLSEVKPSVGTIIYNVFINKQNKDSVFTIMELSKITGLTDKQVRNYMKDRSIRGVRTQKGVVFGLPQNIEIVKKILMEGK